MISPRMQVLEEKTILRVLDEAYEILAKMGVAFGSDCSDAPLKLLADAGAEVDMKKREAKIPASLIDQARKTAPNEIKVYKPCGRTEHEPGRRQCLSLSDVDRHDDLGSRE